MYEFPSEDGEIGPFVSNEILWLKYRLCPLKSCFSAICFWLSLVFFNWHIIQSLHNTLIQIGAFEKKKFGWS